MYRQSSLPVVTYLLLQLAFSIFAADGFLVKPHVPPAKKRASSHCLHADALQGTVVVCVGPTCTQKGSRATLEHFQELAPNGLVVKTISCVSDCAECALGPNVEIHADGDAGPFYPIKNGIKSKEDVMKLLGL
jgi:hypothetical protein